MDIINKLPQNDSEFLHILHIEDDLLDAQFFHELIKRLTISQIQLSHVRRLEDAMRVITNEQIDLVLSDLMLPDSHGLSTLQTIHRAAPKLPIIALTGNLDEQLSRQAIQSGAEDYLIKGETDIRLLSRAIRYAIDRKQASLKLEAIAQTDTLTGLLNRHALSDRLQQAMLRTERKHQVIAILFVDLDLFKCVNDQYGHQVGDAVLQEVARRLKNSVREQDSVARMGGDEFVLILEDVQSEKMSKTVGRKILESIKQPILIPDDEIFITASIGIQLYNGKQTTSADELLNHSDTAMYTAKHNGRNSLSCYRPQLQSETFTSSKEKLDFELSQALGKNQFFLEYQPQIDVRSGELVGAEALLRWRHPEHGIIPPGNFIKQLENNGQILSVGEWVLKTACAQWAHWRDHGYLSPNQKVSVNLSPRQCGQRDFTQRLQTILKDTNLPPRLLDLELTEGLMLENSSDNIQLLQSLKALGVNLTLDDFGTGFSSLCYLTRFPIDRLKVDQSFVKDILHDHNAEAIAVAIISLANNLGLEVVAEGVDQQAKIDLLTAYGCDLFQGFHLSTPLPAHDFAMQCQRSFLH